MGESLSYARTPPSDRVEVTWQNERELEITVPSRTTRLGATVMVVASLMAAFLVTSAVRRVLQHGVLSLHSLGALVELFLGACGGLLALGVWGLGRSWTRIAVRGELLIFEVPRLLRTTSEEFRIGRIIAISVGPQPHHIGTYLLLHQDGGKIEGVMENLHQSVGDLRIVAAALREALRRRQARA